MTKETNNATSHFPFPHNLPFDMGLPFPAVFHPHMGQMIPMGVVPVSSNDMQHYMGTMSKGGLPSMSGCQIFSQQVDQQGTTEGFSPSQSEARKNSFDSSQTGQDTKEETLHPPYVNTIGMAPLMPSVVFFPYFGGFPGYVPGYPQFNTLVSPKSNKMPLKDLQHQQNKKHEDNVESNKVETGSDELDVAQILVDMHVPFLKQVTSSVLMPKSPNKVNQEDKKAVDQSLSSQDTTSVTAEVEMNNSISNQKDEEKLEVSNNIDKQGPNTDMTTVNQVLESEKKNDAIDVNQSNASLLELKKEHVYPEEHEKETSSESENDVLQVEIKTEHESEERLHAVAIHNENGMHIEDTSSTFNDVPTDLQGETSETKHFHELQCARHEDINVCSQQSLQEVQEHETSAMSCDMNLSFPGEVIRYSTANNGELLTVEEHEGHMNMIENIKDSSEMETCDELLNEDPSGLKMTYKCDVCSQLFRSPLGLQKHIEFHTDDGTHYTCTMCFTHFHSDANLQAHIDTHMRKRPHRCSFCPKAFRDPGSLQKHVRVHTGEKPYNCKDCYRSFAEYSSLRKHQRVHTGEQPYKCQYCSKAFSISGNLQRHILIHTGERPYKCNFCPKAFNNPSHLRRHVKNLHFKDDSLIDEAMLSHYGNPGNAAVKIGDVGSGDEATNQTVLDANNHDLLETTGNGQQVEMMQV